MSTTSISKRERRDRIVALAGQVTWIRSVGGCVLRAEMVGDEPVLEVEDDPLFRGFNHVSGLAPDKGPPEKDSKWMRSLPASRLRRMAIAQTGAIVAKDCALSGCSLREGADDDPKPGPGASDTEVLGHFCKSMDIDEDTGWLLLDMIHWRVEKTLFENWSPVHNVFLHIFVGGNSRFMEDSLSCKIAHPYLITAKRAKKLWRQAEKDMESHVSLD